MGPKKTATGTEPPAKRRRINTNTSSAVNLNSDNTSSGVFQWLTKNITSNIMAELQTVGVFPTQHEEMGQKGGADSQNQQEVDSHTDVLTRQEQIPALEVVASVKGLPTYMVMVFIHLMTFRETTPHLCHIKTQVKKLCQMSLCKCPKF